MTKEPAHQGFVVDRSDSIGVEFEIYGNAEERIGEFLSESDDQLRVITKIRPLDLVPEKFTGDEIARAIDDSVAESRRALNREFLDVVLF